MSSSDKQALSHQGKCCIWYLLMMPSSNLKKGTCWPSFKKIIEGNNMISRILVLKTQNEEITFTTEVC